MIFCRTLWKQIDDHSLTIFSWLQYTYWTLVSLFNFFLHHPHFTMSPAALSNLPITIACGWWFQVGSDADQPGGAGCPTPRGLARSLFLRWSQNKLNLYHRRASTAHISCCEAGFFISVKGWEHQGLQGMGHAHFIKDPRVHRLRRRIVNTL